MKRIDFERIFDNIRRDQTMVHCITNYVTINDVANMILAIGASPIMADDWMEVREITAMCDSLVINMGTLKQNTVRSMLLAGKEANQRGHLVVFDPVGVGASRFRKETAAKLLKQIHFNVIRGNISEIKTLAFGSGSTKGVDADVADAVTEDTLDQAVDFVKKFAGKLGCIIAVTGAIDLVADADTCYVIRNGRPEMGKITGTGCQLSGLMTVYLTANPDNKLEAAATAVILMGVAGEVGFANMESTDGNSTYRNRIIDAIYNMDADKLCSMAKYEIR